MALTDKERARNREYYDRRSLDPVFRAKQAARVKDYLANRASPKTLENARQKRNLYSHRRQIWCRTLALDAYGGRCACCGEGEPVFLIIDHVIGGGNKHRKKLGGAHAVFRWLRKNDWPDGFQVLCHNCNWAKYAQGICPHKE